MLLTLIICISLLSVKIYSSFKKPLSLAAEKEKMLDGEKVSTFHSNELLIKVKKGKDVSVSTREKIKNETPIKFLNKAVKDKKVKDKDADIFRWYMLTLETPQQLLQGMYHPEEQYIETAAPAARQLENVIRILMKDPNIETVEPNYIVTTTTTPNDFYYNTS